MDNNAKIIAISKEEGSGFSAENIVAQAQATTGISAPTGRVLCHSADPNHRSINESLESSRMLNFTRDDE